jgi:hypothetical protein
VSDHWTDTITEEHRLIPKWQTLLVSEGEYSDYGVNAIVRAVSDFDWCDAVKDWERECSPYGNDPDDMESRLVQNWWSDSVSFIPYLITRGLVEDVNYRELHVGAYSSFDACLFPPKDT